MATIAAPVGLLGKRIEQTPYLWLQLRPRLVTAFHLHEFDL
ncbi:condesin subunit E [Vibrio alginolyticus 12G01]|nr:condesin subunit E [Vibrio alginolyticus 12G01]